VLWGCDVILLQRLSIEGFLEGSSLVVCAPTSSGKTLVAEAAAAATIARGKRLFYTTPLKALSNQKLRDFRCILVFSLRLASSFSQCLLFLWIVGRLPGVAWSLQHGRSLTFA
jgi:CRISPR/Cas system-associated endonuclease/helicase Cas3